MDSDLLAARQNRRHCFNSTMRLSIEMQQDDQASDLMVQVAYQSLLALPIWQQSIPSGPSMFLVFPKELSRKLQDSMADTAVQKPIAYPDTVQHMSASHAHMWHVCGGSF